MDHAVADVEHHGVDVDGVGARLGGVGQGRGAVDAGVGDLVGAGDAADEAAARGQAGRDLHQDGGQEGGSGKAMTHARVQITEDTDGEGAEGVSDLRVRRELARREVVGDEAGEGDEEHRGGLFERALVDDDEAECERGDEEEGVEAGHRRVACDGRGGVGVQPAVEGRADGDAEAEEEGVDDSVDHADRSGHDALRLKLEGAAD